MVAWNPLEKVIVLKKWYLFPRWAWLSFYFLHLLAVSHGNCSLAKPLLSVLVNTQPHAEELVG